MAVNANEAYLLLGRGKLFFDRFDAAGTPTGLRFMGECDKLEMNPSATTKEYFGMTKKASTKLAQNIIKQTHELDIQMKEYTPENMALALLGDSASFSQTLATVLDEPLTTKALPGYVYQTAKRNLSAVTCKTGSTSLVAGTDYEVLDATLGLIQVLPGTTALDGTKPLNVSYTAGAVTAAQQIKGGTQNKIEGKMVFIGDPVNGPAMDVQLWRVRFQPAGALAFINDDYGAIPLKGEVMDDSANHSDAPLYLITQR